MAHLVWYIAGCLICAILVILTLLIAIQEDRATAHARIVKGQLDLDKISARSRTCQNVSEYDCADRQRCQAKQSVATRPHSEDPAQMLEPISDQCKDVTQDAQILQGRGYFHNSSLYDEVVLREPMYRSSDLHSMQFRQPLSTIDESPDISQVSWASSACRSSEYLIPYLETSADTNIPELFGNVDLENLQSFRAQGKNVPSLTRPDSAFRASDSQRSRSSKPLSKLGAIPELYWRPEPSTSSRNSAYSSIDLFSTEKESQPHTLYTYV